MTHAQKQTENTLAAEQDSLKEIENKLERIAAALETAQGSTLKTSPAWDDSSCFIWDADRALITPAAGAKNLPLSCLIGIDNQAATLLENTRQFAERFPANNALLWGARGMGKSALVKAVHSDITTTHSALKLIEIQREDLGSLQDLLHILNDAPSYRFILFCDDLSFDENENSYKSLKTVLEGGISGRPENVLFYATSNRRHLMPRQMIENERSTAIHPGEAVEEKVSLSDRFGLWLGFYSCDQNDYLTMIDTYLTLLDGKVNETKENLHRQALEWAKTRGNRSGRVAWQFMQHLAGQHKLNWKL